MRRAIRPGEDVSEVVVRAVADLTGQDPKEMPPIAESIDAEAIDELFTRSSGDGPETLSFLFEGCRVTVDAEFVTVDEVPAASPDRRSNRPSRSR